jgi:hypothetical protein
MTTKITHSSDNPAFVPFEVWLENKINSSSPEEADAIRQVVAAKNAANTDVDTSRINNGSMIEIYTNLTSVETPGFSELFEQWIDQYEVVTVVTQL